MDGAAVPGGVARILVVGGTGLLGQYAVAACRARGLRVFATSREAMPIGESKAWTSLDLRDSAAIPAAVRAVRPDLVINAAALTDVDGCEARPEEAEAINAKAAGEIARAARDLGAGVVHASTDYVFDGSGPATEETEPRPLSAYGRTKLDGERRVMAAHPRALVLRLSAVFGWNRLSPKTNAVTWILQKLEAREEARLFEDQRLTPAYARTAAEAGLDLWESGASGVFHVACRDCLSRAEMGRSVAEVFGLPADKLVPVPMASASLKAVRPRAPCLVVRKVEETLKRDMPGFRACLEDMRATR